MPDFEKLLRPNPFAGDDGAIQPQLAAAFAAPDFSRTTDIIGALDRVIVPVVAHAHPGRNADGTVVEHVKVDPLECPDDDLPTTEFPGGRKAFPVFSSAEALAAWDPTARPVPLDIASVAAAALQRGTGLLVLDPASDTRLWIGRSAVAALATGTEWIAPWDDPKMIEHIVAGIEGNLLGFDHVVIRPGRAGAARIIIHVIAHTRREQVAAIANTIIRMCGKDEYVKARLDVVEVVPFGAGA